MSKLTELGERAPCAWKTLIVLAASLFAGEAVFAGEVLETVSHGTYELPLLLNAPGNPQAGELVTCAGGPDAHLLRINTIFDRFAGVCDDLGATPCSGRLIAIQESCTGTDDPNIGESGRLQAGYGRAAKVRVCWDESGAGHCTAEYAVASGESMGAQRIQLDGTLSGHTIGVVAINKSSDGFVVDGNKAKISEAISITHVIFEANDMAATPDQQCALPEPIRQRPACGVASTAIRSH